MTKLSSTKHLSHCEAIVDAVRVKTFPVCAPETPTAKFQVDFRLSRRGLQRDNKKWQKNYKINNPFCCELFKHTNVTSNLQTLIRKLFREGKRTKRSEHCRIGITAVAGLITDYLRVLFVFSIWQQKNRSESNPDVKWALMIFPWKLTLSL